MAPPPLNTYIIMYVIQSMCVHGLVVVCCMHTSWRVIMFVYCTSQSLSLWMLHKISIRLPIASNLLSQHSNGKFFDERSSNQNFEKILTTHYFWPRRWDLFLVGSQLLVKLPAHTYYLFARKCSIWYPWWWVHNHKIAFIIGNVLPKKVWSLIRQIATPSCMARSPNPSLF